MSTEHQFEVRLRFESLARFSRCLHEWPNGTKLDGEGAQTPELGIVSVARSLSVLLPGGGWRLDNGQTFLNRAKGRFADDWATLFEGRRSPCLDHALFWSCSTHCYHAPKAGFLLAFMGLGDQSPKASSLRQGNCYCSNRRGAGYAARCRVFSMCGPSLRFEHVFCSVFVSLLVVVTCSAHAQQIPPGIRSASQLPDAPSAVANVRGSQKNQNVFGTRSPVRLIPDAGESACWMSSCRIRIQNRIALNEHVTQYANSRMAGGWLTFAPTFSRVQPKTFHSADDWQYYGHHLPLAGPVVLRVGKEAQAHPHVVSLIKVIQPKF